MVVKLTKVNSRDKNKCPQGRHAAMFPLFVFSPVFQVLWVFKFPIGQIESKSTARYLFTLRDIPIFSLACGILWPVAVLCGLLGKRLFDLIWKLVPSIHWYILYIPPCASFHGSGKKTKAVQSGWASSAFHWIAEQSGQGLSIKSTNEWSYGTIGELCRSFFVHSSSQLVLLLWQKITIKLCQRTCIKVANTKIFHSASNNTPGLSLVAIQGWLCIRRLSAHFCCFNLIGPLSDTESWNMLKPIGSIS